MNLLHRWLCSSSLWKQTVETQVLPWAFEGLKLGSNVLEVGPGYGATTDQLHDLVEHLTCVEIDSVLAEKLRHRTEGQNITVLCESACEMSLPDATFDGAVASPCCIMFHHRRCRTSYWRRSHASYVQAASLLARIAVTATPLGLCTCSTLWLSWNPLPFRIASGPLALKPFL